MPEVFLSYSRADTAHAAALHAWLEAAGVRCFFDRRDLGGGQLWLPDLERAIETDAAAVAVLVGPQGLGNTQQYEAQLALTRQAREPGFPVVPVILPGTPAWRWPRGFLTLQTWVSFAEVREPREAPAELQRLLAAVRREAVDADAVRGLICPYKGLDAFQEEDAALFFGREAEAETLHATLRRHGVAAVIGRSGSGKSSLARAGLLPRLRRKPEAGGREVWDRIVLRPGQDPLVALGEALDPPPPGYGRTEAFSWRERVAATLRREGEDYLARLLQDELRRSPLRTDQLLILLDQGEELFSRPLNLRGAKPEAAFRADAEKCIALLLAAARRGPASLVLTIRSDFFDDLQRSAFGEVLREALVPLRRVPALRPCIERPAAVVGLRFSPGLVDQIEAEVGADETNLPLLQHALKRTWEESEKRRERPLLSADAYLQSGGVAQAINHDAQRCYDALPPEERAAAPRLFLRLVRPGEGGRHVALRAAPPQDLLERRVVERFAAPEVRLLFLGATRRTGRPVLEVAHEALVRGWPTLLGWVQANRERLRTRDDVLHWRERSAAAGEPELIPPGSLLQRAQELLRDPGEVPVDDLRDYVEASVAAAEAAERVAQEQRVRAARAEAEAAAAEQRARWTRRVAVLVTMLGIGAVLAGAYGLQQRRDAAAAQALAEQQSARADAEVAAAARIERERARAEAGFAAARQAADGLVFDLAQGLRTREGVSAETVRLLLGRADAALGRMIAMAPDDADLLRLKMVALTEFATTYATLGDTARQLAAAEEALAIGERLAALDPGNTEWQRRLSVSQERIGDVRRARGDLAGALAAYQAGLAIRERLAVQDPDNTEWQRDLSVNQERIGDVRMARGDLAGALAAYQAGLAIRERLAALDPGNTERQRDLSVSHNKVGDVLLARGDLAGALAAYQAGLAIGERLATLDPGNVEWQSDLSISHNKVGDVLLARGDLAGALAAYQAGLAIRERLAALDPGNVEWQSDLSISHNKVGDVLLARGDLAGALAAYQAGLAIRERLAALDPGNVEWQRRLSGSHQRIGYTLLRLGAVTGARRSAEAALAIARDLASRFPDHTDSARDVRDAEALMRRIETALKAEVQ